MQWCREKAESVKGTFVSKIYQMFHSWNGKLEEYFSPRKRHVLAFSKTTHGQSHDALQAVTAQCERHCGMSLIIFEIKGGYVAKQRTQALP